MDEVYIGRIANTHGIRGMVKVLPTTDDMTRFELLKEVTVETAKGENRVLKIASVKYQKNLVLIQFEEINTMDEALLLKQGIVKIPRDKALPLGMDEYYIQDLEGIDVFDDKGERLGKIADVIFTGSNDVYVVDDGSRHGLLLPAIKECILKVDLAERRMTVHMMEGLGQ